jgi:hypothetical protein
MAPEAAVGGARAAGAQQLLLERLTGAVQRRFCCRGVARGTSTSAGRAFNSRDRRIHLE